MINNPLRFFIEKGAAGVNIDLVVVDEGSVTSFVVFAWGVEEKSWDDCFSDERVIFTARFDGQSIFIKEFYQLFSDIFSSAETSLLNEVVFGPGGTVALVLPGLKDL